MRKVILHFVKATFPFIAGCATFIAPAFAQQNIIANKDNTHPAQTEQSAAIMPLGSLTAEKFNGYNEIKWTTRDDKDTRLFVVEYSTDGINFQSAGEMVPGSGNYELKHNSFETRPLLYRIRIEQINGRSFYSRPILLKGDNITPVKIYPTVVRQNVINVNAGFPVERTAIVAADGSQVFSKELGGMSGNTAIVIPSLARGQYWMTFYGNGWHTTSPFMIAD